MGQYFHKIESWNSIASLLVDEIVVAFEFLALLVVKGACHLS
jgi:hypothetical protein